MRGLFLLIVLLPLTAAFGQSGMDSGLYTVQQAADGRAVYIRDCAICHGTRLEGAEAGPDLAGRAFRDRWRDRTLGELAELTAQTMPVSRPGGLADAEYRDLIAFILNRNGYAPGSEPLALESAGTAASRFEEPARTIATTLPAATRQAGLMVEWLHHRGDAGSTNYSALDQINAMNAGELEVAWRWKSDNFGPQPWPNLQTTPIMANGVLYACLLYTSDAADDAMNV